MPKDRITQAHQGYGFVEFMGEEDADYAIKIMNMIKIYGKPIRVNKVRSWYSLQEFFGSKEIDQLADGTPSCGCIGCLSFAEILIDCRARTTWDKISVW